jgi:hypothetical protein
MPKWIKLLVGLALLPVALGVTRALGRVLAVSGRAEAVWLATLAGAALWLAVLWLLPKPTRLYVFGHELTHALWAWAFGAKVQGLKAGARGGQVTVSRSNFLVALAPYFFPVYALLVVAGFVLGGLVWDWRGQEVWFHLLLGAAYAFHMTFTVEALQTSQSDLAGQGYFFSIVVIWLGNGFGLLVGAALLTAQVGVLTAMGWAWEDTGRVFHALGRLL